MAVAPPPAGHESAHDTCHAQDDAHDDAHVLFAAEEMTHVEGDDGLNEERCRLYDEGDPEDFKEMLVFIDETPIFPNSRFGRRIFEGPFPRIDPFYDNKGRADHEDAHDIEDGANADTVFHDSAEEGSRNVAGYHADLEDADRGAYFLIVDDFRN